MKTFKSLLTEDKLRNSYVRLLGKAGQQEKREKEGGRRQGKKKEEEKNPLYIIWDGLREAALTDEPTSQWLESTKVYFLLTVQIHRGSAGLSAPHCPQSGTQADGASAIWNIIMGRKEREVNHALTFKESHPEVAHITSPHASLAKEVLGHASLGITGEVQSHHMPRRKWDSL